MHHVPSFVSSVLLAVPLLTLGCSDDNKSTPDGGGVADSGSLEDAGGSADGAQANCFPFSDDSDLPLALDGAFTATSDTWQRPDDVNETCPAAQLVSQAMAVPFVSFSFCNEDSVSHFYDVEWLAQTGPGGEDPLDDAFLVVYDGIGVPTDAKDCREMNNDGSALDGSSELFSIEVPAGGSLTVVGTASLFDPGNNVGTGGYIMVVTNSD